MPWGSGRPHLAQRGVAQGAQVGDGSVKLDALPVEFGQLPVGE